jgi:uncharacterized protein (TIGR02453 family)
VAERFFTPASFDFLARLAANNERDWFRQHQQEYEDAVRTPALNFIAAMGQALRAISPHFLAEPRKVGGSLMRVHRDLRFGRDPRPYKTNVGIHFRHRLGRDVHAPGFYLHIEPGDCFVGVGIWHPDAPTLARLRGAIAANGRAWLKASRERKFARTFDLAGDSLAHAPRGYAKDHPLLADLKRKDFIAVWPLAEHRVTSAGLHTAVVQAFQAGAPFMRFLCRALELQF